MPTNNASRRELLRWTGWYLTLQCLVLAIIALRYLTVGEWPPGMSGTLFGVGMYIGHFISITALLFLPVLLLAALWPRRGIVLGTGVALAVLTALVLVIDTFVYQQYRFHINSVVLSLAFSSAADDVFVFSSGMLAWTAGAVLLLVAAQCVFAWGVWRLVHNGRWRGVGYTLATLLILVFVGQNLGYAYFDATGHSPIMRASRLLPAYEPLTAKGFLDAHGFEVVHQRKITTNNQSGVMHYPLSPLQVENADHKRPNILFLVIESWRFDAIGERITPNISRFASRNLQFTHHFSGGNASRTGLFSLFYGLPGTYWHSALNGGERPALIDVMNQKNYRFFVSSSADLTTPPFHRILFRGIEDLRLKPEGGSAIERDRTSTRRARAFLRQDHERPFFGFVFLDAPHAYAVPNNETAPFQPSWDNVNYMALGPDFDPTPFFNRYKNAVHFADSLAGRILDTLRKQKLMQNTIVVITADHGQEFNDLGMNYWGHNGNFARYQTRVPLVMHWPGRPSAKLDHITSHMDVAPTLLDHAFGADEAYHWTSAGRDLFQSGQRLPLILSKYRQYAAVNRDRIVVFRPWGATEVRDKRFRRLADAEPSPQLLNDTLKRISRFNTKSGSSSEKTTTTNQSESAS